jgi:hypothetical protein
VERKEGEEAGRGGIRGCGGGRRGRGEEERKGEMERLTSGARVSATAKEKEKEREHGPARGEGRWAARPLGEKGEVFFQTSFKTTISFQIQIKTLSNFFLKNL